MRGPDWLSRMLRIYSHLAARREDRHLQSVSEFLKGENTEGKTACMKAAIMKFFGMRR
jgi:hypothetical protein